MVMFSAYNMLLSRVSMQKDIVCGIPIAGREHVSTHNIVGYFVNTMILRNSIGYKKRFIDLLHKIKLDTLEAFQYQSYPLEIVLDDAKMNYPDISVFFNMLNIKGINSLGKLDCLDAYHICKIQDVKFDMELYVKEYNNGLELYCNFKKSLFLPEQIEYMMKDYLQILKDISVSPNKSIKELLFKKKNKKLNLGL